jgi:bla regulator protein BlaR1
MTPSYLPPLANHLWQSTLFVVAVGLLTLLFRKNRAAVRHRMWLTASVKFLVPFSLLVGIGSHFQWRTASATMPPPISVVMDEIGQPFTASGLPSVPMSATLAPQAIRIPAVLLFVWTCGFAASIFGWFTRWRQLRRAMLEATPLNLAVSIRVMSCPKRRDESRQS